MNWLRENPFVAGLIAVLVVGCGALGFLIFGALQEYTTATQSYDAAVQKLQQLQNQVPYPDPENVRKAQEVRDRFRQELERLRQELSSLQKPTDPAITPQQFSDELRAAFNEITRRAETAKIKLPENFYLGFNAYSNTLPSPEAAPALARQLSLIVELLKKLFGNNPDNPMIQSLDSLSRPQLPVENPLLSAPAEPRAQAKDAPKKKIQRMPVSVTFTTEQGKFRIILNSLLQFPQFLIIRSLTIENSKLLGPPVAGETSSQPNVTDIFAEPTDSGKRPGLNVLLGREVLTVSLQLELLDFQFRAPSEKP